MKNRVRFAPSPTGYLHLGNARMACLNYFLAKKIDATYILRIDDTDFQRVKEEYINAIKTDLTWLGITWEEEFKQSDNTAEYNKVIAGLKAKGLVYECYETSEELEYKKNRQLAMGKPPIYDRAMLNLSNEDKEKYLQEGRKPYLRFKISHEEISWVDLIKGEIKFHGSNISDPVITRDDGSFLYTFISVVDDINSKITHILRGEDHITNTAVQIQMFNALNGTLPQFAHMPLIVSTQGQGFSKRENSLSLGMLRSQGILPLAINNYLHGIGIAETGTVYSSVDEIIEVFNLETYNKSSAKFDEDKLLKINLHLLQNSNFTLIAKMAKDYLELDITEDFWNAIKLNINTFLDIKNWHKIAFDENLPTNCENKELVKILLETMPQEDWNSETWGVWLGKIKNKTPLKGKDLFKPLRMAFSGNESGPEFKDLILLIGKETLQKRLQKAV